MYWNIPSHYGNGALPSLRYLHPKPTIKLSSTTSSLSVSLIIFRSNPPILLFNVQAAKELGYYGYDTKPFEKYLTIKSSKNYMYRVMLPADLQHLSF